MSGLRRIVCWQPVLTDHQAYTLAALAEAADAKLVTVATAHAVEERVSQGWKPVTLEALKPALLSGPRKFRQIRRWLARPDDIHLFCSPFGDKWITIALLMALAFGRQVYAVSEPFSPVSMGTLDDRNRWGAMLKAKFRPALYRFYGCLIHRRISGVFAISPLAAQQYRRMGIDVRRIFPFGYFVPAMPNPGKEAKSQSGAGRVLRICFVGSLIARKGSAQLATAARAAVAEGAALRLDVYGPGDRSGLGADDAIVRYKGSIAFGMAGAVMAEYDALVVPSEHDGWAVVVNEAVSAGVPVIVSSNVGAASMVSRWGCGFVYDGGQNGALTETLVTISEDNNRLSSMRAATAGLSALLTPAVAGEYMWAAIKGDAPACPWYYWP